MKKIFVLTGEPSGDKLASKVISKLQKKNSNIEYSCVGGTHLNSLGIKSIFNLKEITYIGFTSVILNIFKIKNKINKTVEEIIKFNPDILFSVDSPDFTLRVAEKVKKINPNIKTIHYVAPQVWVWREGRVKKLKKFLNKTSKLKLLDIFFITWFKISLLIVGSFIKLLKSLLFEINFNNAWEFSSIFDRELDSLANSYRAKEYLLAEVSENPLLLLNLLPLNVSD